MKKNRISVCKLVVIMILTTYQVSNCQWNWINPLPGGNNYGSVSFLNDSIGWIVGNKGSVYKTTDFGQTWNRQSVNLTSRLNDIHMVNENTGYIVGDSSVVLKTYDGGNTWEHLELGLTSDASLISVCFTDELKGWISGDFSFVFSTNDGGQTWSAYEFWWADWIGDVQFVDSLTGYRAGRYIHKTTDGGKSWNSLNPPVSSQYNDIFFINKDTGWVVSKNQLIQTTDGGLNWKERNNVTFASQIYFTSIDTGWYLGDNEIGKTTDGGETWSAFSFPGYSRICITPSMGYAVGANGAIAKLSNNTSNNWSRSDKNFVGINHLNDIFFNDPFLGFAVGDSGKIFRTIDGGQSWDFTKVNTSKTLHKVFFTDSKNGWTISDFSIYSTADGGDSWQISYNSSSYFKDVFFINSETGWVVASNSNLLHTNNKGVTWIQQGNTKTVGNSNAFTNTKSGWIVGLKGKAIRTTDGGLTWTDITLPTKNGLYDIEFYDEKTGWITGDDGIILKTENDGLTWTIQTSPVYDYGKISVIDSSNVWLTATFYNLGGLTMNTNDGGENWMRVENECYQQLNSIFFKDPNSGFAAGNLGTILKFTGKKNIPDYPTGLVATAIAENKIALSWLDNSVNEDGFEILRSDNYSGNYKSIKILDAESTNYVDSLLSFETYYWYRVKAYNSNGKSAWTREDSARTLEARIPEIPILDSPSNFETDSPISITLTWNASIRASTYRLQVDEDNDFLSPVFDLSGIGDTSKIVGGLSNNTLYYWRVNASNSDGTSYWSIDRSFTTSASPETPALVLPIPGAINQPITLVLSWHPVFNATYQLQVDDNIEFSSPVLDQSDISEPWGNVTGLEYNVTYYWRVRASHMGGNGNWSETWNFQTAFASGLGSVKDHNTVILEQNFPNPFDTYTLFRYFLPHSSLVKIQIFSFNGLLVNTLVNEMQIAGHHEMEWKGMDHSGFPLPSGLYLVRLLTNEFCEFKKLEIIRK